MELYFFDTSALVKRYYREQGTQTVDSLIESDTPTVVSSLSIIETVSAFRRKYNRDELTEEEMQSLLSAFFDEALSDFIILPLEESLLQFSFNLIIEEDLRTLDSLQLSAALSLDTDNQEPIFICADSELVSTAENNGLKTITPQNERSK